VLNLLFCSKLTRSRFGSQNPPQHQLKKEEDVKKEVDTAHDNVKTLMDEVVKLKSTLAELGTAPK